MVGDGRGLLLSGRNGRTVTSPVGTTFVLDLR